MRIGIDIDGVLTDDDQYLLDCTSKYCYENNRKGFVNPYGYEFDKWIGRNKRLKTIERRIFMII